MTMRIEDETRGIGDFVMSMLRSLPSGDDEAGGAASDYNVVELLGDELLWCGECYWHAIRLDGGR